MKPEVDKMICDAYPKMFIERGMSADESCMAWGLAVGDGWSTLINMLCNNIQRHIDWTIQRRNGVIKMNAIRAALKQGNTQLFDIEYGDLGWSEEFTSKRREELTNEDLRPVPDEVEQVVVEQVKEKFGTLRFYYRGGDDYISGLVAMAESMSGYMCEGCGAPALTSRSERGWVNTTCQSCKDKNGN